MAIPKTLSAGIVPVQVVDHQPRFLILRSYNYWDFPKGVVHDGEEPFHAALRELEEETSLHQVAFPYGKKFYETEPYSRGKVARYYVATVSSGEVQLQISEELGRPEHHEFRWVTASEARKLLNGRVQQVLDWAESQLSFLGKN